jgi:hypothetical protein
MVVAGTVIIVQMNVEKPVSHFLDPLQHTQFREDMLVPGVQAQPLKWIVDFVYKLDK